MQGRLSQQLKKKLEQFDLRQPYVWKLKLSEADFSELEACIKSCISENGKNEIIQEENAITTLIYMAEWYKRKYLSGSKNELLEGLDLETLWVNTGLSSKAYLYRDANGSRRWEYSIYVLGGLAIQHELSRNDNMKFLKGLCRLYHGEDYTLENIDDQSRAVAFRESIKRKQSLFEYMKEVLNGNMPFCIEDFANPSSDVNRFIATIKAANDEILKVKFRFEWQVIFNSAYTHMNRRLNVWLKPEEVGGTLHQYLRYDRVNLWGVPNPEKQHKLVIYIRFKNGEEVVEPSTMDKPIITYLNTGAAETGFVTFGTPKCAQVKHIPSKKFNLIEIVAKDEAGNEYIAQQQETREFMQLWRVDDFGDTWTSTQNTQKETALVFSNRCKLKDESISDHIIRKCFKDQLYGLTHLWNWFYIYDNVIFTDEYCNEQCLYNRIGYDQITTKLYTDTIKYCSGGKVRYFYIDDPEISIEPDVDEYPLIFGCDDLIVRHFATKDDILNAQPEEDGIAELVEWKQNNGRYSEWNSFDEPSYGQVQLRITVKGKQYSYSVVYLPRICAEKPVIRDYEQTIIRYKSIDKEEHLIQDTIPMDGKVLKPTLTIIYGEGNTYTELNIYRPTLIKEVLFDGKIIDYKEEDDVINIPYIFKDRVQVNDFSRLGYQAYECSNLACIYSEDFLNIKGNANTGWAALAAWNKDAKFRGRLLDSIAPSCINVCFGLSGNDAKWKGEEALVWNYSHDEMPVPCSPTEVPDFGIIFQDLSKNKDLICNYPIQVDDDIWGFDDVEVSIVKCFEVANEAETYFFLMKPLIELQKRNIVNDIYKPLLIMRNNILTDKDKQGLLRFAEEFAFDWAEFNIKLDNE